MRHRIASKQLGRDTKHREALLKNLLRELVEHGAITTTQAKAKVIKPMADKIVTKAKQGDLAARRSLHQIFGKRDVVNTLVDRVAPVFKNRTSGFTRITQVGVRSGDNATLVSLSWVEQVEKVGDFDGTGSKDGFKPAKKATVVKEKTKKPAVKTKKA